MPKKPLPNTRNAQVPDTAPSLSPADKALAASELRYRRLFETAKDGILILDAETGTVVDVNPFLLGLLGYSREHVVGEAIWALGFLKDTIASRDKFLELQRQEYVRYENLPLEASDGRRLEVEFVSNVYLVDGQKVIQCNIRNITERRQAEAALRESEERYRSLYVESRDAIMTISPEWGFLAGNPATVSLFACRDEPDLKNRTPASLSPERQPDGEPSAAKIQKMLRLALEKGSHFFEWTHRRADGTDFPATVLLSRLDSGGQMLLQATVRDMSQQLRLEGQLRQAQKMAAVGRLAGGVAHDFNNLLMGILGYAELCRDHLGPDHQCRAWLDEIKHVVQRSAEITRQLLTFARQQTFATKVLDVNDAVSGMLKLLGQLIGENITLAWLPGADLGAVRLDPSQVDQILANLCLNARDAIGRTGTITLETGNIDLDADDCARYADATPGAYVCLTVADDGGGMNPETLTRIFEPFFTTKDVGQGTGLGLATVYGIVKQNNGFIDVKSGLGKGTTFRIYLPQVPAEPADKPVNSPAGTPTGRGETILLVEDEGVLRRTYGLLLNALAYKVISAESPEAALRLFTRNPEHIHLLLTDVVMPGMDGRQLTRRIRAVQPHVKVLFMSGYTPDLIATRGALEPNTAFIAKPFTRDDLARKVRDVLETRSAPTR